MAAHVREAVVTDAERIGEIHVRSWQWAYDGLMPPDVLAGLSIDNRAAAWRTRLASDDASTETFVAEVGGEIVGFVTVGAGRLEIGGPDVGELVAIYLLPEFSGAGIGRALHDGGIRWLVSQGFRQARLWVLTGNARARAFYERQGWRADGAIQTGEHAGATTVEARYALQLNPRG